MLKWIKNRLGIIQAARPRPVVLVVFGTLQAAWVILPHVPFLTNNDFIFTLRTLTPWYVWVIAWLALFWMGAIEYSLKRKENFDKTSSNFFKAFLEFLIKEGHGLFNHSEGKDFYTRINDWQRKVIEGIAIGQGPKESEKYFQKMDSLYPLAKAYRESLDSFSNESLSRSLQGNLAELESIRLSLAETKLVELEGGENLQKKETAPRPWPQLPSK